MTENMPFVCFYRIDVPIPKDDASEVTIYSFDGSKTRRTGRDESTDFHLLNTCCCRASQVNSCVFDSKTVSGCRTLEKLGTNLVKYVAMPRILCSSVLFLGLCIFKIASTFFSSTRIPSWSSQCSGKLRCWAFIKHAFAFVQCNYSFDV